MKNFQGLAIIALVITGFQIPKAMHAHQQGIRGAQAVCTVAQAGGSKAQILKVAEKFTYAKYMDALAKQAFKAEIAKCQPPA